MAGPVGPFQFHPAAYYTAGAVQSIQLTLSGADVDLTLPAGPTGGYCARAVLIGGTAGNVVYYDLLGAGPFTQAVAANQTFQQGVSYIADTSNGTTASPVTVQL